MTTITHILAFAIGTAFGAFLIKKFNPKDITYIIDKLRAKKGGSIDVTQNNTSTDKPKKERRKLFKLKNRRK